MQPQPEGEKPSIYKQEPLVVSGQPFLVTTIKREAIETVEIDGKQYAVTFKHIQPYNGTLDDLKAEIENGKAAETQRYNEVIADKDAMLADIEKVRPKGDIIK